MKATKTKRTDPGMHGYYWRKIGTFIEGWVIKNASGYSTAWGMLEDRYYKAHGVVLSAGIDDTTFDLYGVAEKLGCVKELYDMAIDLFIKKERR